ncbi:MAG: hypothetical protein LUF26_07695 [Firmicutes bacterium]|nr:hypothetical protein [Bacillota bacterium]
MRKVTAAAVQMSVTWDRDKTLDKAERLIRAARIGNDKIKNSQMLIKNNECIIKHN